MRLRLNTATASSFAPVTYTLTNGSVTTTQGTITAGNGAGDTNVAVNVGTIADAASVTIQFDVVINTPLPAGVTRVGIHVDPPALGAVDRPRLEHAADVEVPLPAQRGAHA